MRTATITLEQLGWGLSWEEQFKEFRQNGLEPGRIAVEDKHCYSVLTAQGEYSGQASGRLLHQARSQSGLPKVGDWVALSLLPGERKAVVHRILPRKSALSRKVPGREIGEQVLAANVDVVFLVQALGETFNPRLVERQLVMVHESGARPVVVLNKEDLSQSLPKDLAAAASASGGAPVITVSARTGQDLGRLAEAIRPGETIVFIGKSGVGKSTLINRLYGEEIQATAEVREGDSKGRHTTSWRELIVLPGGGIVIDTPGMRELQLWTGGHGVGEAFPDIENLATSCHYRDCTHTHEANCAVKEALTRHTLPQERYRSFLKLQRELAQLGNAQYQRSWTTRKRPTNVGQHAFNRVKGRRK